MPPRDECKLVEPWFKTRYTVEDIPDGWRKRWADPEALDELHLPEPNVFIAEDTSLKPVPEINPKYPRKISDSPLGEMFHRMDDTFKQPRAHVYFHLLSPGAVFGSVHRREKIIFYDLQGWSLLGHRFSACFILKFALQRGEGEKREGVKISKRSTQKL